MRIFASSPFPGLDLLTTAVLLRDRQLKIRYANPAAESLFALNRNCTNAPIYQILSGNTLFPSTVYSALNSNASYNEHELTLVRPGQALLRVSCTITPVEFQGAVLLLEFRQVDQQLRIARDSARRTITRA